jgi:hypothetical protein
LVGRFWPGFLASDEAFFCYILHIGILPTTTTSTTAAAAAAAASVPVRGMNWPRADLKEELTRGRGGG